MKVYLSVLALTLVSSFAQGEVGQVVFANRANGVDAPVTLPLLHPGDPLQGLGEGFTAQLFLQDNPARSLTPLVPTSTFYPAGAGGDPTSDRYWRPQIVDVPGVAPNTPATFLVRFWQTSAGSYDGALFRGQSAPFVVTVGGGLLPPANLTTLRAVSVAFVPEPSTVPLALLGLAGFALYSRSSHRIRT